MKFTQAQDYPIDIYYLVDLSKSMDDDLNKVLDLGRNLIKTLKDVSGNSRIGFGFFRPGAYGFRNHLTLSSTHDFAFFVSLIN